MSYTLETPVSPKSPETLNNGGEQLEERRRVMQEIRTHNPTAALDFLAGFCTEDLQDYLEHLKNIHQKHVRLPGWVQRRAARLEAARRSLRPAA